MKKNINNIKKVSVYTRRNRSNPNYYRSYQYFDKIDDVEFTYRRTQFIGRSDKVVSERSVLYKIYVYLYQVLSSLFYLVADNIKQPSYIVVIREFVTKKYLFIHKFLLKRLYRKGIPIYWDFDDNLLESNSITKHNFCFFSRISSKIIVTNKFLQDLLPDEEKHKVILMPTTDGDMYQLYNEALIVSKAEEIKKRIVLVWVGSSVNLIYLEDIVKYLDIAAKQIKSSNKRDLILRVVCNKPLDYKTEYLKIENVKWQRNVAIIEMCSAHIGLMPLRDNEFTRGKGGFKLVQYLSIGVPGIASNVGYNTHVLNESCGRLINQQEPDEWTSAIIDLSNPLKWKHFAHNAFVKWEKDFSYTKNLNTWKKLFEI